MSTPATVRFNVGGTHYEVSRSLIESFPDTMLARICSETWQKDDEDGNEPIFIDRNGERFQYLLDYMRDAKANLPITVSKEAFLLDLKYFGFDIDDSKAINTNYAHDDVVKQLPTIVSRFIRKKKESRYMGLAHECFSRYFKDGSLMSLFPNSNTYSEMKCLWECLERDVRTNLDQGLLDECFAQYGLKFHRCEQKNISNMWQYEVHWTTL
jgi:hypothetical protein